MNLSSPSFEAIVRSEAGYVHTTLRRLGVRDGDLDDLTQEVFIAVHRRYSTYNPRRPVRPWLFAFAFRAAGNYRRLARHRREQSSSEEPTSSACNQEQQLLERERRSLLECGLQEVDLPHRAALVLVDLDEISPRDAAVILNVPLKTLYSRVRNGRQKLREALRKLGQDV